MEKNGYKGRERRKFPRMNFAVPLAYKVCKRKTISRLLKGYTSNISHAGLLCNIKERVKKNNLLWLAFDRSTLAICEGLEKDSFIYQSGIIGKAVRVQRKKNGTYDVGIQFITRKEKNASYIYPKIYFLKKQAKGPEQEGKNDEDREEPEEQFEENAEDATDDVEEFGQDREEIEQD